MSKSTPGLWRCPNCGREFAKQNQSHSCHAHSVDDHFRGKPPQLRQTFVVLIARLGELGPVRVDAVQSSINLIRKYHFGVVVVKKESLRLGFITDEKIAAARITDTEELGPRQFAQHVRLRSPGEVDDQLLEWLRRAYEQQVS